MRLAILLACVVATVALAWTNLRPVAPVDTPYFRWQPTADDRYELSVSHIGANPAFRRGVTSTPVPQSGSLRITGPAGSAEPGAMVEVSNPRTGRGYSATADASGGFSVEAEVRRGDTLDLVSRRIEFRAAPMPAYASAVVSSP